MKKRTLMTIIMLLCFMLVASTASAADFGDYSGDSDYDYGGSYNSGSYDYGGSDYSGSDNSYSPSSSDGDNLTTVILVGVVVIFLVFGVLPEKRKESSSKTKQVTHVDDRAQRAALTPISEYVKIDPGFNEAALCERASNLYVKMQNGWTAKDIEPLRPYFTDAFFTQMERSLKDLAKRGETNYVERIAVLDVSALGFNQTADEDHIILRLRTRIIDYTVKDSTQEVIRGSRQREKFMTYEWDVMRQKGMKTSADGDGLKNIKCPSCGAPLDINASARCPYCRSVIQQQAYDWVISSIRGIKQQTK